MCDGDSDGVRVCVGRSMCVQWGYGCVCMCVYLLEGKCVMGMACGGEGTCVCDGERDGCVCVMGMACGGKGRRVCDGVGMGRGWWQDGVCAGVCRREQLLLLPAPDPPCAGRAGGAGPGRMTAQPLPGKHRKGPGARGSSGCVGGRGSPLRSAPSPRAACTCLQPPPAQGREAGPGGRTLLVAVTRQPERR